MKAPRLAFLLLASAGCSEGTRHATSDLEFGAASLTSAVHRSDTLVWTDSSTRSDTTFFVRGRAITSLELLADSQWIRVHRLGLGIPVGLSSLWDGTRLRDNAEIFTLTYGSESPATLPARLALARSRGMRMVTVMTGGARANYLTDGVFDMSKWIARMERYNTPAIRAAVAQAVRDGVLIANTVMDEPFNTGGPGNEANSWGPKGTMSKARVDSMCAYAKNIFPMLPQGVFHDHDDFEPSKSYQVCDLFISQYRTAKGPLPAFRDAGLALARRDNMGVAFAINVLDGGTRVKRKPGQTTYLPDDCPLTTTGVRGTYFPNCRMTAQQVREAGQVLGEAGCFLTGFRYDSAFMARPDNQQAFRDVVQALENRVPLRCTRG